MYKEIGRKTYNIWLLGDSNPKNWENELSFPFDAKHPIRHNIITPVFDNIQEILYKENLLRLNTNEIFIRNAIENPDLKPKSNIIKWNGEVVSEIGSYKNDIQKYKPKFIFTFGSFAFEFARRCINNARPEKYNFWNTRKLGEQFRKRIVDFNVNQVNIIPLLHRSISGGRFLQSHNYFCNDEKANYFEVVGNALAKIMLKHKESLKIWSKKPYSTNFKPKA